MITLVYVVSPMPLSVQLFVQHGDLFAKELLQVAISLLCNQNLLLLWNTTFSAGSLLELSFLFTLLFDFFFCRERADFAN